jgi:D-alanyl-D-alanine dipeptidase
MSGVRRRTAPRPVGGSLGSLGLCLLASFAPLQQAQEPPPPPPAAWRGLIGEYGSDTLTRVMILERDGHLMARFDSVRSRMLEPTGGGAFRMDRGPTGAVVRFRVGAGGRATAILLGDTVVKRRALGPEEGSVFRVVPVRPVAELRHEALAASPPAESGDFLATDLVELVKLDSAIHLDIRYASSRNFLGQPLYTQARAFLQRPAAEALVRVANALHARGYGLLIHDGYRPWYVTKMFWDATPPAQHEFVANPADGSRHNRGEAVDLSLYDLSTGRPVEMPGTYDEFSHRSYPGYEGGTSLQRWHRELLRSAMEAEGFTVFTSEWWHFDYKDWKRYHIGNITFEKIR